MVTHAGPDFTRLVAFAGKLGELDEAAWERIHTRCATLDTQSVGGLLGRAELIGRSMVPETNPYAEPLWHSALTTLGTAVGTLTEVATLLGGPSADRYEREAQRLRHKVDSGKREEGPAALLSVFGAAARQRAHHPGAAAALQAVAFALLVNPGWDSRLQAIYGPFEPEIPYAALAPDPGQHAA